MIIINNSSNNKKINTFKRFVNSFYFYLFLIICLGREAL